jgi:hypothetical protein
VVTPIDPSVYAKASQRLNPLRQSIGERLDGRELLFVPYSWIIKGHRIGVTGIEPADCARTDSGQHDSVRVMLP